MREISNSHVNLWTKFICSKIKKIEFEYLEITKYLFSKKIFLIS